MIPKPAGDGAWAESHAGTDTKRWETTGFGQLENGDRRDGQKFGQLSRCQGTSKVRDLIGQSLRVWLVTSRRNYLQSREPRQLRSWPRQRGSFRISFQSALHKNFSFLSPVRSVSTSFSRQPCTNLCA